MKCPYCDFVFVVFVKSQEIIPDIVPLLCEQCGEIALLERGQEPRKMTFQEDIALKMSPVYQQVMYPMRRLIWIRIARKQAALN